ncbi:MAG: methylmalonyl-CoA mutase family protein, partial [Thermoleophilaceae bacterium]
MVEAIKQNYPQREIADASAEQTRQIDRGERVTVGVNGFADGDGALPRLHLVEPALEHKQMQRLAAVRARRDPELVERALEALRDAAAGNSNLMDPLLHCARADCSEGEIVESLQRVMGSYRETPVF